MQKPVNMFNCAKESIKMGEATCIIVKHNRTLYTASGPGVRPLLQLFNTEQGREMLKEGTVVDKIVGRAAAMLASLGGAGYVYGEIMSEGAQNWLCERGIAHSFGTSVPVIENRTGTGMCPIEQSVVECTSETEAFDAITATVERLMAGKG